MYQLATTIRYIEGLTLRQAPPLDEQAVTTAANIYEALDSGDEVRLQRLVSSGRGYQQQLRQRLATCSHEARPFLQAALGHLDRAMARTVKPIPELTIMAELRAPAVVSVPEPQVVKCPFCSGIKYPDSFGIKHCPACSLWLALRNPTKLLAAPPVCLLLTASVESRPVALPEGIAADNTTSRSVIDLTAISANAAIDFQRARPGN